MNESGELVTSKLSCQGLCIVFFGLCFEGVGFGQLLVDLRPPFFFVSPAARLRRAAGALFFFLNKIRIWRPP